MRMCKMMKSNGDHVAQPIVISSDENEDDNDDEPISRKNDNIIVLEVPDSPVRLVISPPFRLVVNYTCL